MESTLPPELPVFSSLPLHPLLQAALEKLAYQQTTPVQAATIPQVLAGKDLLISAETGSGKTAAFLLPCLQQILTAPPKRHGIEVLILVPTRELAQQILGQCESFAEFTRIRSGLIIGSEGYKQQQALLRDGPAILIATPGRLIEHLQNEETYFDDLSVLILDEADRMLDMGFSPDVLAITQACNSQRQTLLFTATLTAAVIKVSSQLLSHPETIKVDHFRNNPHRSITQQIVLCDDQDHKKKQLVWLLENETYVKALVFTNTKLQADGLLTVLRSARLRVAVLHGDLDQSERNRVMGLFRKGSINVLIATDLAARGLDIDQIQLVINFEMARNANSYVHRVGRTGRAGEQGLAISLINSNEWNLMCGIERYLNQHLERRVIKELVGSYKGPKKPKASEKAAKKETALKKEIAAKKAAKPKVKVRLRYKKNVGKRRVPTVKKLETDE